MRDNHHVAQQKDKLKTIVYVDGFNLYHRLLKHSKYKWLNLAVLCDKLLPELQIVKIKYFTATISSPPHDPNQQLRQEIYLRALSTEPRIEIVFGNFVSGPRKFPEYPWKYSINGEPSMLKIYHANEKGSDVNLASHLVFDAIKGNAEAFIVITNDSDQICPIQMLINEKSITVGILVPDEAPSKKLMGLDLNIIKRIRKGALAASQFPEELFDRNGKIHKPNVW